MIKRGCILLVATLSLLSSFASAKDKTTMQAQLHQLCMERFARTLDARKAVCDCSVRNMALKNNEKELAFIYKVLKSKSAPKKMNDEQVMLVEFSRNVSVKCVQDPKWTLGMKSSN